MSAHTSAAASPGSGRSGCRGGPGGATSVCSAGSRTTVVSSDTATPPAVSGSGSCAGMGRTGLPTPGRCRLLVGGWVRVREPLNISVVAQRRPARAGSNAGWFGSYVTAPPRTEPVIRAHVTGAYRVRYTEAKYFGESGGGVAHHVRPGVATR